MSRSVSVAALALLTVLPLFAQTPQGWKVHIDHSMNASDPDAAGSVKFVTMGGGFHATNPQAAIYWNPANTATGNYTLRATFTLNHQTMHSEYYGLIFGGSGLEGAGQKYLYFMVAQDGSWLLKQRDGRGTQNLSPKTDSSAVKTPDASGKSVNTLEVRVMPDKTDYYVNGTKVHTAPKTGATAKTDGIYGIRVNHMLDVQIDGFSLTKQ